MSPDAPLVEVRDLTVDYVGANGIARAVNGISFDLSPGEAFGLAGESGGGKSTVAFALARLTRLPGLVSGGSLRFAGKDVLALSGERLRRFRWSEVSFVFQSAMSALNPVTRIIEQLDDAITAHRPNASVAVRCVRVAVLFVLVGFCFLWFVVFFFFF